MTYDTLYLPLPIYDSAIMKSSQIHNKPLTMTRSFIYASYFLCIDTLYLSTACNSDAIEQLSFHHSDLILCIPIGQYLLPIKAYSCVLD